MNLNSQSSVWQGSTGLELTGETGAGFKASP